MAKDNYSIGVFIPEIVVSAADMSKAIEVVATRLLERDIITSEGYSVLSGEISRLKRNPAATSWELEIDRDNPVTFTPIHDKNGECVFPRLTCAGICVEQDQHSQPPFTALDIAIEIDDFDRMPVSRWHVDWANSKTDEMQPGPLVHLQYGGHVPGHRDKDHRLKVPRWNHPPMEVVLLCEVMVANFYQSQWEELREDYNWCWAISIGQKLCYSAYLRKMVGGLSISSKTVLHGMWASEWKL